MTTNFDISDAAADGMRNGFLLSHEVGNIPSPRLGPFVEVARSAAESLAEGKLGQSVGMLPWTEIETIGDNELAHGKLIAGFLTQAYVWEPVVGSGLPPRTAIPSDLAQALVHLSVRLNEPPIFNYADYILRNSRVESKSIDPSNATIHYSFSGTSDEHAFIGVHTLFEFGASSLIELGNNAVVAASRRDADELCDSLMRCAEELAKLRVTLEAVSSCVSTEFFRDHLRIFLQGWKNIIDVRYEGTSVDCSTLRGETGAQSSVIPFVDAVLGLGSLMPERLALKDFISYMPQPHRELVMLTEGASMVRTSVVQMRSATVRDAYNTCLTALIELRLAHLKIAFAFIGGQHSMARPSMGTGGTDFGKYLSGIIESLRQLAV